MDPQLNDNDYALILNALAAYREDVLGFIAEDETGFTHAMWKHTLKQIDALAEKVG